MNIEPNAAKIDITDLKIVMGAGLTWDDVMTLAKEKGVDTEKSFFLTTEDMCDSILCVEYSTRTGEYTITTGGEPGVTVYCGKDIDMAKHALEHTI